LIFFKHLKGKRRIYENSNTSPRKNINLQKNPLKETKILQKYYNFVTKSQVSTQAKIPSFKNPHIKK
jgi:hypothetical protein